MEFENNLVSNIDDEGYENIQTEDVQEMGKPTSSRNEKQGKFASYLDSTEPVMQSSPNLKDRANFGASIEDMTPEIKSAQDDLDNLVEQVTDQILMNQLPHPGNLRSHKKKDVRARLRCFQALLQ